VLLASRAPLVVLISGRWKGTTELCLLRRVCDRRAFAWSDGSFGMIMIFLYFSKVSSFEQLRLSIDETNEITCTYAIEAFKHHYRLAS
jgi:hypothetical protein